MATLGPLTEISQNVVSTQEELSEDQQMRYNKYIKKAKEIAGQGHISQAYELYQKAYKIHSNDKLKKRIEKIKVYLEAQGSEESEDGDDMVHMGNGFNLFKDLYEKLYAHQREGVLWMWDLYKKKKGGILGDDMGLGKTIQVIAYLSGAFDSQSIQTVLIVLPVAVICNWEREFEKWAPGIRVLNFHGGSKRDRERAVQKVSRRGGVCLTSYGMLVNNSDALSAVDGREMKWDYVILDEGHKIKNPSNKCSKGLHAIPARNRLILTGTPVQNNLKEMWALFDWTHQGSLLGTAKTFSMEFEQPIVRSRQKDATAGEKRLGQQMSETLRGIIGKYFMRRTKEDVKRSKENQENDGSAASGNHAPDMPTLTRKNDLVVWVYLSEVQLDIYEKFLNSEDVKELLNSKRSPLMSLTILKKLCDHPRLMSNRQCHSLGLDMDDGLTGMNQLDSATADECAALRIKHIEDNTLIRESGKMVFLVQLLDQLKNDGHRCLIFSQSLKVLDIIQQVMSNRGHKIARLDGTVKHVYEREDIIKRFQNNKSYSIFLLTTQVGGVGLTLTAADRVVIYDPSWNPATDAQAVDRAFRIGQDKDVVIYRLITCGSIEEKIYRRQVFKDSITKQTTGDTENPMRYFTSTQLRELFVLDNPRRSETQVQLNELLASMRKTDTSLDEHIAFLHTLDMFGISDHDLMFNREAHMDELEELDAQMGAEYIEGRIAKAQRQIDLECQDNVRLTQQLGKYPGPQQPQQRPRANPAAEPPLHPHPRSMHDIPTTDYAGEDSDGQEDTDYQADVEPAVNTTPPESKPVITSPERSFVDLTESRGQGRPGDSNSVLVLSEDESSPAKKPNVQAEVSPAESYDSPVKPPHQSPTPEITDKTPRKIETHMDSSGVVEDSDKSDNSMDESELPDPLSVANRSIGIAHQSYHEAEDSPIAARRTGKRAVIESDDDEDLNTDLGRMDISTAAPAQQIPDSDENAEASENEAMDSAAYTPIKAPQSAGLHEHMDTASPAVISKHSTPAGPAPGLGNSLLASAEAVFRQISNVVKGSLTKAGRSSMTESPKRELFEERVPSQSPSNSPHSPAVTDASPRHQASMHSPVVSDHNNQSPILSEAPGTPIVKNTDDFIQHAINRSVMGSVGDDDDEEEEEEEMVADEEESVEAGAEEEEEMSASEDDSADVEEEEEEEEDFESSEEELDPEDEARYVDLVRESRVHYKRGEYADALDICLKAVEIFDGDEQVFRYLGKLQTLLN